MNALLIALTLTTGQVGAAGTAMAAMFAGRDSRALIEQALGEPTKITLQSVTLADAMRLVTEQTGVDVRMSSEVMALVPGGGEMVIQRVDIANVPLGQGLTDLFSPLGMEFEVAEDHVRIVPKPALRALGHAPSWAELGTLQKLGGVTLGGGATLPDEWKQTTVFDVAGGADSESAKGLWNSLQREISHLPAGSGDYVLSAACARLGWAWMLDGAGLRIVPAESAVQRLLQQTVSLRMNGRPLFEVIAELERLSGVSMRVEPGALATLPDAVQRGFWLDVRGQTVERALESVSAYTGLSYLIGPDGVTLFQPSSRSGKSAEGRGDSSGRGDPFVGKVVVPLPDGTSIEWVVRWSELPDDLRQRREKDLERAFEAIRRLDAQSKAP